MRGEARTKQTIYRWWPSKVDILLDTLIDDASHQLSLPEQGSVVEGVRELPAHLDVDAALDALLGPVLYRALIGAKIPQTFIDGLVADTLGRHIA